MRHYFVINDIDSRDYGVFLASTDFSGAQRDDTSVSVPGRNGDLILSNGRWKNATMKLSCYIPHNMRERLEYFREFIQSLTGYVRYEDSINPEEYRMVRFKGPFAVKQSDRVGAAFEIQFDAKPQRWLKDGEVALVYTEAGVAYNATLFPARPLIRCYGSAGTIKIGDRSVIVTGAESYVDIDCEAMEIFEGDVNRNNTAVLSDGEFPVLSPGVNGVEFTGFSVVSMIPRWWRV